MICAAGTHAVYCVSKKSHGMAQNAAENIQIFVSLLFIWLRRRKTHQDVALYNSCSMQEHIYCTYEHTVLESPHSFEKPIVPFYNHLLLWVAAVLTHASLNCTNGAERSSSLLLVVPDIYTDVGSNDLYQDMEIKCHNSKIGPSTSC